MCDKCIEDIPHGAGHNDHVTRNDSSHDDNDYGDNGGGDDDDDGDDEDDDRAGDDDDAVVSCDTRIVIPIRTYIIDGGSAHPPHWKHHT